MSDAFEVFSPSKAFETFVLRAYKDHLAAPLDPYSIKTAVHYANALAERHWFFMQQEGDRRWPSARAYREYLVVNECSDFQLIWDIDDNHKHMTLTRPKRVVTNASQTGLGKLGGRFGKDAYGEGSYGEANEGFAVRLDDGSSRSLTVVLKNVIEMWARILK